MNESLPQIQSEGKDTTLTDTGVKRLALAVIMDAVKDVMSPDPKQPQVEHHARLFLCDPDKLFLWAQTLDLDEDYLARRFKRLL